MSKFNDVKEALDNALMYARDSYDAADSAESHASDASNYASQASNAIETAMEELSNFQPFDSDEMERLMDIQFALVEVLGVNTRRINRLVDGDDFTYQEVVFFRNLHNLLVNLTTRGLEDIIVYSDRITEFETQYLTGEEPGTRDYNRVIKYYVDKKEATNVQG